MKAEMVDQYPVPVLTNISDAELDLLIRALVVLQEFCVSDEYAAAMSLQWNLERSREARQKAKPTQPSNGPPPWWPKEWKWTGGIGDPPEEAVAFARLKRWLP